MRSIRLRLFVLLLSATVLVWSAAASWIYVSTRNDVQRVLDNRLVEAAGMVASLAQGSAEALKNSPGTRPLPVPTHYGRQLSCQIWTLDGRLVGRSGSAPDAPLSAGRSGFSERTIEGEQWRVYTLVEPEVGLRVLVGDNLKVRHNLIGDVMTGLLLPALVGIAALAALLWSAVGQGLSPLRRVARELAGRDPAETGPLTTAQSSRELQPLVDAINGLFERLERLRANERHFIASAAHELQTPLAGLKAHAQIALSASDPTVRDKSLRSIDASVDRTSRLVEQLLDLAREEAAAAPVASRWIRIESVVHAIGDELRVFLQRRDVRLQLDGSASNAEIYADEPGLTLALRNLIRNAVEHSPEGSEVQVTIGRDGGTRCISIVDQGPGILAEDLPRIRDRFVRGSRAKNAGSGLGLSIVELVAARFDAELDLANRPGGGFKASLQIPSAAIRYRS
jgi:two-component system sensor histidine kinase QseC